MSWSHILCQNPNNFTNGVYVNLFELAEMEKNSEIKVPFVFSALNKQNLNLSFFFIYFFHFLIHCSFFNTSVSILYSVYAVKILNHLFFYESKSFTRIYTIKEKNKYIIRQTLTQSSNASNVMFMKLRK